ncbi:MAG: ribosome biogenesis GTPase Der [Alphaproteobacteria bacterium]|nr:ribosome biogenesis GTPase Der [Alphaproteobacteria bacterium]
MFSLAIIGRPNVGKSTLFNRLAGKKLAIVDDTPGVTRDWREAEGHLFDRTMRIIDTAGLEENFDDSIQGRMRRQTEAALAQADAILFVIDGREGLTPMDQHFAGFLRRQKKPIILAVNKCENQKTSISGVGEAYALGFGEPIPISAEHGVGMEDLYHALSPHFPDEDEEEEALAEDNENFDNIDVIEGDEDFEFEQEEDDPERPIKIAIVGRPNVGKSTLLNAIVQDERVMTGPEAGITRDAITVDWQYEGRKFKLVDTAGMRRKSRVQDNIERMSVDDTLRAIRLAQVVILVLDGNAIFEKQDLQIAEHIIDEGRALVVAVNKWDCVEDRTDAREELEHKFETSLAQTKDVPYATISALNGKNIDKVLYKALQTYDVWNKRVPTGRLNRWLAMMESRNPAPLVAGRQNRMKYIAQIKTRPPTFALWVSRPDKLPAAYKRYIINGLRKDYDIPGVPIRLLVRRSKNPYA